MIRIHRHASSALKNSMVVDKAFYFSNFEFFNHVSSCFFSLTFLLRKVSIKEYRPLITVAAILISSSVRR